LVLEEIKEFFNNLPTYLIKVSSLFEILGVESLQTPQKLTQAFQKSVAKFGDNILNAFFNLFGGALSTTFVISLAFFISIEKNFVGKLLEIFAPLKYKEYLFSVWREAQKKVGGWFFARVIGMIFIGAGTFAILTTFNVKYSFLLSLMAGLLDFIPIIGPLIAGGIIAFLVGLTSLWQALITLIAFVILQQLENNLLFPILFKKFMGLSPVLVLIALLVGGKLWGIAGSILSVPLIGVLVEIIKDYINRKRAKQTPSLAYE